LLNSMPMGFYQPAQIVIDARKHGVEVRPVDINYSHWDNTLEESRWLSGSEKYCALRLGFRQVKGLREDDIKVLTAARKKMFTNIHELRDIGLAEGALEKLADADAFRSINLDRREAFWEVSTKDRPSAIFHGKQSEGTLEEKVMLPQMSLPEHVAHDYAATSLSLKAHPVSFIRQDLERLHILSAVALQNAKNGDTVKVAGLILVRQRPGTASGICFITIEDETGCANLVVFQNLFNQYRKEILQSKLLMVEGKLQREGEVIHVIVQRCFNLSKLLRHLVVSKEENQPLTPLARADERSALIPGKKERIQQHEFLQEKIFPEARNFR
jgi:error-prone DNA polymerase